MAVACLSNRSSPQIIDMKATTTIMTTHALKMDFHNLGVCTWRIKKTDATAKSLKSITALIGFLAYCCNLNKALSISSCGGMLEC